MDRDYPVPTVNADTKPYWDAAREGKLVLKSCSACRKTHFPPRHLCPICWSPCDDWIESRGEGSVYSFTIMRRAPSPEFHGRVPYVVALVQLDDGPRMLANVIGDDALAVRVGERVRVVFETRKDGFALPQFVRAPEADAARRTPP